jgi:hypothetical protein
MIRTSTKRGLALCALLLICCKGKPTYEDVLTKHQALTAPYMTGFAKLNEELGSPTVAKSAGVDPACRRAGLVQATKTQDGNIELIGFAEMQSMMPPIHRFDSRFDSLNERGPLTAVLSAEQTRRFNVEMKLGSSGPAATPDWEPLILRMSKISHAVLVRRHVRNIPYDVFLVALPAGKVECSFRVGTDEMEPYDPYTGNPSNGNRREEREKEARRELERELTERFGLRSASPPTPEPESVTKAVAMFARAHAAVGAAASLPACTAPPPAGALQMTWKRLSAYGRRPFLAADDLNAKWEPSFMASAPLLQHVRRGQAESEREAVIAKVMSAPAFLVVQHLTATPATFDGRRRVFTPGTLEARRVQMSSDGTPTCETRRTFVNPPSLKVTYDTNVGLGSSDVAGSSIAELVKQVEAAFPLPP